MTDRIPDAELDPAIDVLRRIADRKRAGAKFARAQADKVHRGDAMHRSYSLAANTAETEAVELEEAISLLELEKERS